MGRGRRGKGRGEEKEEKEAGPARRLERKDLVWTIMGLSNEELAQMKVPLEHLGSSKTA